MGIVDKDGYKFLDGLAKEYIVIESNRLEEYIKYINENDVKAVYLSNSHYNENSIDFLDRCNKIKEINITSESIKNYDGLRQLTELIKLNIDEPKGIVDLNYNKNTLQELIVAMNNKIKNLSSLNKLKRLRLWKYKPKIGNLEEIREIISLESLGILQSPILSLSGIEKLVQLKELEISRLTKLEDISCINSLAQTLTRCRINYCKNIKNIECIRYNSQLLELGIDENGELMNLDFVKELIHLRKLTFVNTKIINGDLSPCVGIEYVGFMDKPYYTHTFEELNPNFKIEKKM